MERRFTFTIYEALQLKNDIKWNFKEKENVKASTKLYCCKFSDDFGKYIFAEGSQVNAVKVFDLNGRGLACIDWSIKPCTCNTWFF